MDLCFEEVSLLLMRPLVFCVFGDFLLQSQLITIVQKLPDVIDSRFQVFLRILEFIQLVICKGLIGQHDQDQLAVYRFAAICTHLQQPLALLKVRESLPVVAGLLGPQSFLVELFYLRFQLFWLSGDLPEFSCILLCNLSEFDRLLGTVRIFFVFLLPFSPGY